MFAGDVGGADGKRVAPGARSENEAPSAGQLANPPPSIWHSKLEPASEELYAKDASLEEVELGGPEVISVSGAWLSRLAA